MVAAHVVTVVQLPPPVTGLSAVNEQMVARLADSGKLKTVVNVAPPVGARGVRKHLARLGLTAEATLVLIRSRGEGATTLYMPSDGGAGMIWNILVLVVARTLGYRLWMHHHSFAYINRKSRLMDLQLWLAPLDTRHIALCQTMLDQLEARYPSAWSRRRHTGMVLSNAFMTEPVSNPTARHGRLTIGHLANLTAEKGAVRFVELFRAARAQGLDLRARIAGPIGDGPTQSAVEAAVRDHENSFEWLGPVYGSDKTEFYRSLDAFVFPSDYLNEAQPLVLLEALAAGAAILVTERGCMACDHAGSPGLTASIEDFKARALEWLHDQSREGVRGRVASTASLAFGTARTHAERQLSAVISEI